ncbi:MAG: phosphoribosylformylglycinamidine synthase subunit PurS [Dehalococcoidia bacterium]
MSKPSKAKQAAKKAKDEPKLKSYAARVFVSLKPTVNDPEGSVIAGALGSLGFTNVEGVRAGKYFQVALKAASRKQAGESVAEMCSRLLANPVIETFSYEVKDA